MLKHTLAMTLLVCTVAWRVAYGTNTTEYGYIRLDVHDVFVGTACYTMGGGKRTGEWKDRSSGFRSCHGHYMLVKAHSAGSALIARIFRDGNGGNPDCGTEGMRVRVRIDPRVHLHKRFGPVPQNVKAGIFANESGCGRVEEEKNWAKPY